MTKATGPNSTFAIVAAVVAIAVVWLVGAYALWSVGTWALSAVESPMGPSAPSPAQKVLAVVTLILIWATFLHAAALIAQLAVQWYRDRRCGSGGSSADGT